MKDKNKKIIETIIDFYGYSTGMATAWAMSIILRDIMKNGIAHAWHSTGDFILWLEIIAVGGLIPFCVYKFIKNMVEREKIAKYLKREKVFGRGR